MAEISEELLDDLYNWIDQIHLSRPKKDLKRDFSDGVLVAEVISHFSLRLVDLHSYSSANNATNKIKNWNLLNRKVFKKLDFEIDEDVIKNIIECRSWAIEHFLMMLRRKLDMYNFESKRGKAKVQESPVKPLSKDISKELKIVKDSKGKRKDVETLPPTNTIRLNEPLRKPKHTTKHIHNVPSGLTTGVAVLGGMSGGSGEADLCRHVDPESPAYRACKDHRLVSKVVVEEKEQQLLVKAETIQILQAKIRRLEHLVHLKDCRIDDLQAKLEQLESRLLEVPRHH